MMPFSKPSVAPMTEDGQDAYDELEDMLSDGTLSSVFGWAVSQRSLLSDKEEIREVKSQLRLQFGESGRSVQNWALLVYA